MKDFFVAGALVIGVFLLVILVLILGVVLPFYMVWQGEWMGIAGLVLYVTMQILSRFANKVVR